MTYGASYGIFYNPSVQYSILTMDEVDLRYDPVSNWFIDCEDNVLLEHADIFLDPAMVVWFKWIKSDVTYVKNGVTVNLIYPRKERDSMELYYDPVRNFFVDDRGKPFIEDLWLFVSSAHIKQFKTKQKTMKVFYKGLWTTLYWPELNIKELRELFEEDLAKGRTLEGNGQIRVDILMDKRR